MDRLVSTLPLRVLPLLALALSAPLHAAELPIEIRGVNGEPAANVRSALSLERLDPARRAELGDARLNYLLRRAPVEARRALEPYGYYSPKVEASIVGEGAARRVRIDIALGEPVRVKQRRIEMEGDAKRDLAIQAGVAGLRPRQGEVFDHRRYEAGKADVERRLNERGYFQHKQTRARVEIERAGLSADIDLAWDSGPRHRFGQARIGEHQLRPGLVEKLVPWTPGEPYEQSKLLRFQQSLTELDYFGVIDLQPNLEEAEDLQVPIDVALTPGKRSIYTVGLSYGTDSGPGVNLGWERRWVNDRGHKFRTQLDYAQRRQLLTTQYRVPAFAWLDGWYTGTASLLREEFGGIDSERAELVGSRSGRIGVWNLTASLHWQRDRFDFSRTRGFNEYTTLVYPSLRAEGSRSDDPLYPTRGWSLISEVRAGLPGLGSNADFQQAYVQGRYVHSFSPRDRVLLRGELGWTGSDDFSAIPPSLRFYAGGDRSVRGYGYRAIGPVLGDVVVGAPYLATAGVEYERMFSANWGAAAFVDAGDAFAERGGFEARVGAGLGLRWRSPVGPVRLDLAHGFDRTLGDTIRIHFSMGPDL